ncbi:MULTISPECIES: hypothetical protein [Burkholderia cepacia complex]|uniref:hypothetical protein n=1 Tax=Burkholderia cenocepacia TaxID=95486 RepID=UPI002238C82A|nr:hypothetical protein [Burkholderia cenocepacia]MCW5156401.1 hypothetical protein [Burkholderia cenocepacia]
MRVSTEDRLYKLKGLDTSTMTLREIASYLGEEGSYNAVRQFVRNNHVPVRVVKPNLNHITIITKESLIFNITKLSNRPYGVTYENLGKCYGFSKQRAKALCVKYGLTEQFQKAKAISKRVSFPY